MASIGRPRNISSPEEMQKLGDAFFDECDAKELPYTITGLCIALGLSSRQSLIEYAAFPEFTDTVKGLKMRCERFAETRLYANNPTGAIFALKNYGWTDKTQQEVSGPDGGPLQAEINVNFVRPDAKSNG